MMIKTMNSKRGFSLVELAIGLAVVAILILAISLASGVRNNARLQAGVDSVQALRSAAESYIGSGKLNYTGLTFTTLQSANLLPAGFTPTSSNPWGGNYTIAPNTADATKVDIALTAVPSTTATQMTSYFTNLASATNYDSTKQTWTVTF